MVETATKYSEEKASGFLAGIGHSLRDHIDERLKSPFGGAFVISWLAINWKPILLIMLSDEPIKQRIEVATKGYIDWYNGLLLPTLLAIGIAFGFYLLSAFFLVIYEFYEWLKRSIRKKFDAIRWVPPSRYIESKAKLNEQIRYLQDLASDNLGAVDVERTKTQEVNEKLVRAQVEVGEATNALAVITGEKNELLNELNEQRRQSVGSANRISEMQQEASGQQGVLKRLNEELFQLREMLEATNAPTHPSAWNKLLNIQHGVSSLITEPDKESWILEPASVPSIARYLSDRFPAQPVNTELLKKIIDDARKGGITSEISNVLDIHKMMNRSMPALLAYSGDRPDLFKSSADYFSKALGFVSPRFREVHRFSDETRKAFLKYQDLIDYSGSNAF